MRHYPATDRAVALHSLKAHKVKLTNRFGIARLTLFGSTARDGRSVDVVTEKALRHRRLRCSCILVSAIGADDSEAIAIGFT